MPSSSFSTVSQDACWEEHLETMLYFFSSDCRKVMSPDLPARVFASSSVCLTATSRSMCCLYMPVTAFALQSKSVRSNTKWKRVP